MAEISRALEDGQKAENLRNPTSQEAGEKHSGNVLNFEAGKIRQGLLDRMTQDKGVISSEEEKEWKKKLADAREDTESTRRIKNEFEAHWRESQQSHEKFDKRMHSAEDDGWLEDGEHETLDKQFSESRLAQKETMMAALEKTLGDRQKEIKDALSKIDKNVMAKHEKALKEAKNWQSKKKEAMETREHSEGLKDYTKALGKYPIGTDTVKDFEKWYVEQNRDMQQKSISELDKVMKPYVDTWEDHKKLPKAHQNPKFKELGRRERESWFKEKERELGNQYDNVLHGPNSQYFSPKEIEQAEKTFEKDSGKRGERIARKAQFLDALPGHFKLAKKLHDQFDKFPDEIKDIYKKEFRKLNYEEKKKMLEETIPKEAKVYLDYRKRIAALDSNVIKLYNDDFEDADKLREKSLVVKEAEKYQKLMDQHQGLRKDNAALYNSPSERSRELYEKEVHNVSEAGDALRDLKADIKERTKVHTGIKQLPKFLADRIEMKAPFGKIKDALQDQLEIKKSYDIAIPFMIKSGEKAEAEGDEANALNSYLSALKLDPDSKDLQKMVAHLRQKGIAPSLTPSSPVDEATTEAVLKKVEESQAIDGETYELARKQLFLDMARKHKEATGATGSSVDARRQASKKMMSKEAAEVTEDLEEAGALDDFTVDETGTVREKHKINVTGEQTKESDDLMHMKMDMNLHKGEGAKSGLAEVEFVDSSGQAVEQQTVQKKIDEKSAEVEGDVIDLASAMLQREHGFSKKQAKRFGEDMKLKRKRDQAVKEQLGRLAA
jgi:hypothetical protein